MKSRTLIIALSVALLGIPLYAQHGHGSGGGMGHSSMGHSSSPNSNSNSHDSGKGSKGSSVSDHLEDNTKLASKLQSLLPAGTNLQQRAN